MDKLTEPGSPSGLVIVNFGDPSYRYTPDSTQGITQEQAIFLRLIAYLLFSERIAIPTRHILEGQAMANAVEWSIPLLEEGLIVPERRAPVSSFEDLARFRNLPEIAHRRAHLLDAHAARVRKFRYGSLSEQYRELLTQDLRAGGPFARTIDGGTRGRYREAIRIASIYPELRALITPEDFVTAVIHGAPELEGAARRWAMARYYTTPLLFDNVNTREVPHSAANLLIRGGVMDRGLQPFSGSPPAEYAFHRLAATVPFYGLEAHYREYCEALLEVRRAFPEARKVFADVRDAGQLKDAGLTLWDALDRELKRQQRTKSRPSHLYRLLSSLVGEVAGAGAGALAGAVVGGISTGSPEGAIAGSAAGAGLGFATEQAVETLDERRRSRVDRRKRPWVLAIDKLEEAVMEKR